MPWRRGQKSAPATAVGVSSAFRAGTLFEASKTPLFLWAKALLYVMQGKRGMSAQELQRHLGLKSYGRV